MTSGWALFFGHLSWTFTLTRWRKKPWLPSAKIQRLIIVTLFSEEAFWIENLIVDLVWSDWSMLWHRMMMASTDWTGTSIWSSLGQNLAFIEQNETSHKLKTIILISYGSLMNLRSKKIKTFLWSLVIKVLSTQQNIHHLFFWCPSRRECCLLLKTFHLPMCLPNTVIEWLLEVSKGWKLREKAKVWEELPSRFLGTVEGKKSEGI